MHFKKYADAYIIVSLSLQSYSFAMHRQSLRKNSVMSKIWPRERLQTSASSCRSRRRENFRRGVCDSSSQWQDDAAVKTASCLHNWPIWCCSSGQFNRDSWLYSVFGKYMKYQFKNQREQLDIIKNSNKNLKEINKDLASEKANSKTESYFFIVISCLLVLVIFFQNNRKKSQNNSL